MVELLSGTGSEKRNNILFTGEEKCYFIYYCYLSKSEKKSKLSTFKKLLS